MRRMTMALGGVLAAAATVLATAPLAAAQATGNVFVVHGIPDTPVDVYVDGELALDDFEPGTFAGPVQLPAGPHDVAIFPADAEDDSGDPVLEAAAEVPAGGSVTLAAHLSEDGSPTLTAFVNDVTSVEAGQARLVVRHTAAAPAVDVLAGGAAVVSDLTNPNQTALNVPAGTVSAAVAAAGNHRARHRPGRPQPGGGHGHVRARHRVARGRHARPGGLHRVGPAQRPLRRALGRSVRGPVRLGRAGRTAGRQSRRAGPPGPVGGSAPRRRPPLNPLGTRPSRPSNGGREGWRVPRGPVLLLLAGLLWLSGCGAPAPLAPAVAPAPAPTTAAVPAAPAPVAAPSRVRLSGVDVDVPVVSVGVDDRGDMEVPEDVGTVGWYRFGPPPGSAAGSSVLSGHVDDRVQGRGAFYRLSDLATGDPVEVELVDGTVLQYRVNEGRADRQVGPAGRPAVRPRGRAAADPRHLRWRLRPGHQELPGQRRGHGGAHRRMRCR